MTWLIATGPEARADYDSIIDYYLELAPEQVTRFRSEVNKLVTSLVSNPYLSMDRGDGVRKRATAVFPYHVWYKVDESAGKVQILAVFHYRRDPLLLQSRLG